MKPLPAGLDTPFGVRRGPHLASCARWPVLPEQYSRGALQVQTGGEKWGGTSQCFGRSRATFRCGRLLLPSLLS